MSSTVEQIKDRLSITDVVSGYVKLHSAGSNFKARCPFHNEKTASFFLSPSRQTYHCFGCDKGGDMFSFIQEIEGLDFPGALKILAESAGVSLSYENKKLRSERESLFEILDISTIFFEKNLKTNEEVINYLKKRGVTGETAKKFRLGYSTKSWNELYDLLKKRGYKVDLIEKAGLIISGNKGYYDRFRSRIMFPIQDSSGRVVGFSGRIFGEDNEKTAKYINSPETELYNKSKILFGFDKAKVMIRKEDFCVLVEGQVDLLMSHQVDLYNTVAVSGTALSEHHLKLINRLTNNIIIAFDPDNAGVSASKRGIDIALSLGMDVKVVHLPEGLDPADLILKDKEKWGREVKEAKHIIDFYIKVLANRYSEQRIFRVKVGEVVLPYVARLKDKINQAHFIVEIARKLGIAEEPLWEQLRSIIGTNTTGIKNRVKNTLNTNSSNNSHTKIEMLERKIFGIFLWQKELKELIGDIRELEKRYEDIISTNNINNKIHNISDMEKKKLIFETELYYNDEQRDIQKDTSELISYLEEEILKEKRVHIKKELQMSENKEDNKLSDTLLKEYQNVSKRIDELRTISYNK